VLAAGSPQQKGWSAAIRSIGRNVPSTRTYAFVEAGHLCHGRGEGAQEVGSLGGAVVSRGRTDTGSGNELGAGVAVAEVGEGEQGLQAGAQAPPADAEPGSFVSPPGRHSRLVGKRSRSVAEQKSQAPGHLVDRSYGVITLW
jgi:hypothetical protein